MYRFIAITTFACLVAFPCFAQDSVQAGSAASAASVDVGSDLTASGIQTAVGASVIPASVAAGGSAVAGSAVTAAGHVLGNTALGMSTAAGGSALAMNGPLPVTRKVIVSAQPAPRVPYDAQDPQPAAQAPR